MTLEQLCDALVAELGGEADDDIAVLAVRAHPEDRPRPLGAGPSVMSEELASELWPGTAPDTATVESGGRARADGGCRRLGATDGPVLGTVEHRTVR